MIRSLRRIPFLVPLCGLALGPLTSCSSPTGPAPVPCAQTTVFKSGTQLAANTSVIESFTTAATGAMDVTVDWASDSSVMSLVLAQAPCSLDQLQASGCNVLFSLWSPPKPMQSATSLLPSGTYVLFIGNHNPVQESTAAQVVLRSAGCAPLASASARNQAE
jgi:hypothetical protein